MKYYNKLNKSSRDEADNLKDFNTNKSELAQSKIDQVYIAEESEKDKKEQN